MGAGTPAVAVAGGVSLAAHECGLTLERSITLCPVTSIWRGGRPCAAHLVIVRLTKAAADLYAQRNRKPWADVMLCLDPKSCGLSNMAHISGILELLR